MEALVQSISNGLVMGFIYVLVALGLTLIFGIMRIVQFAHGEIYMISAYCVYFFAVVFGLNLFLSFVLSVVILAILGIFIEKYLFRPFRGRVESSIIVAIGLILLLQTIASVGFGTQTKSLPTMIPGVVSFLGAKISWDRALAVIVGLVLTVLLFLFIKRTRLGQAMVSVSQEPEGAILQGVDVNRISGLSMSMGCILAAIAGALMGSIFQRVEPVMGSFAMAQGIAVIILGGLGSIPGAVIGGLFLGLLAGIIPLYADTTIASMVSFAIIIIILFIRPTGLLGHD
jgi:branched-chain amino acid transport system permease protein